MKKYIFIFGLLLSSVLAFSQEPDSITLEPDSVAATTAAVANIPDSLCVTIEGEKICFPADDATEAVEIIRQFANENKGNWPKNVWGIITLIVGFLLSARGTALIANATRIYNFLRSMFKKTLNVVAFIAGVLSSVITYVTGIVTGDGFSWDIFGIIWPATAFGAVYVYETWIKKPKEAEPVRS